MAARLSLLLFALPSANGIVIPIIHTNTQAHRNAGTSISPILANRKRMTRLPEGPLGLSRLVKNGYVNVRHVNKITWPCPHRLPLVKEKEKKKKMNKSSNQQKPSLNSEQQLWVEAFTAFSFQFPFLFYGISALILLTENPTQSQPKGWWKHPEWVTWMRPRLSSQRDSWMQRGIRMHCEEKHHP